MKRIHVNYNLRESTVVNLRKYAEKTGFNMSHIVDMAIVRYIAMDILSDPANKFIPVNCADMSKEAGK